MIRTKGVSVNRSYQPAVPVVPLALGGTGSTSAATARTSLGLGDAAVLDAADISAASHTHVAADVTDLGSLATVTPTGTPDGTKFLRDDASWQVP